MDADDLQHKQDLLKVLKKRLRERELQFAQYGVSADPVIITELKELRQEVAGLEREILHAPNAPRSASEDNQSATGKTATAPTSIIESSAVNLYDLLGYIDALRPLLYWLYRPVPAKYAEKFFDYMQVLFHVHSDFFENHNRSLHWGTEHVLRVISPDYNRSYVLAKLGVAHDYLYDYFKEINHTAEYHYNYPGNQKELIEVLRVEAVNLAAKSKKLKEQERRQIMLLASVMRYLHEIIKMGSFLDVPEGLIDEFRNLIEPLCKSRLNLELPSKWEFTEEYRNICSSEWND